ncbi:acetyltransferase [Gottschalkia purinilytica]|uniref:Acetyltransferase n=1 Tax=Gottschalkia purinilytica TaxID=1503 RepID=A0A0L0WAH1_GOTPU|nr:GNAT family protein [Gottschalkia purinilytica]KNF08486.1 acetyltransferase [Gottschalkia purinilytica]
MKTEIDFLTKPTLKGEKVILRPFATEDWEKMIPLLTDPEVKRLTGSVANDEEANAPISSEEAEHIKQWYQSRNQQTDRLDLAIIERANGKLVGEVVFNDFEETTRNVNFRILIGASGRGKGLGTDATALFLQYGFEVLGLHKVELEVYSFNPRAEKVYRKNGFVLEGIKREDFLYNDEYIDTKIFGLLKKEYEGR